MKYIKPINEQEESEKAKPLSELQELKSLPYRDFMQKLISKTKSNEFQSQIDKLSKSTVDATDYGVIKSKYYKADNLIPTQSQIGLKETLSWLSNKKSIREIIVDNKANLFNNNRILIANNKWIIDGHHRWSYVHMLNPRAEIPCININLPGAKPEEILKDIQLSISSTYNDIYVRDVKIEYNISQMDDNTIYDNVKKFLSQENLESLRESYAETDLMKTILREFIIPESLYETTKIQQTDFLETDLKNIETSSEVDADIKKIEEIDNDNPEKNNILGTAGEWIGFLDPTGVTSILMGIDKLYEGEIWDGMLYIIAGLPIATLVAKPLLIGGAKSMAIRTLMKSLSECMKRFDAKKAAEIWISSKSTKIGAFLEFFIKNIQKINDLMSKILRKVSERWYKFKFFYWLFKNRIVQFFTDMFNWRERLGDYLTKVSVDQAYGILSSNLIRIKRTIIDKKVDKNMVNFAIGPHPVQSALKARINPYDTEFKGVPKDLLKNLPSLMSGLKTISVPKQKKKMDDFSSFDQKNSKRKESEDFVKSELPIEKPVENPRIDVKDKEGRKERKVAKVKDENQINQSKSLAT